MKSKKQFNNESYIWYLIDQLLLIFFKLYFLIDFDYFIGLNQEYNKKSSILKILKK